MPDEKPETCPVPKCKEPQKPWYENTPEPWRPLCERHRKQARQWRHIHGATPEQALAHVKGEESPKAKPRTKPAPKRPGLKPRTSAPTTSLGNTGLGPTLRLIERCLSVVEALGGIDLAEKRAAAMVAMLGTAS